MSSATRCSVSASLGDDDDFDMAQICIILLILSVRYISLKAILIVRWCKVATVVLSGGATQGSQYPRSR